MMMDKLNKEIKHVLIIRFQQIGEAVLSTVVCNTIRKNFPEAVIDMTLNDNIAPLFEHHPAIDHIWKFTQEERTSIRSYLKRVKNIVRSTQYDVIIDMRSTMHTFLFPFFSLSTPFRIGLKRLSTIGVDNFRIECDNPEDDEIRKDLRLLEPLNRIKPIDYSYNFSLYITDEEKKLFREYMTHQGIDFSKPVILVGITSKVAYKTYGEDKMVYILQQFIKTFPEWQIIFNYASGQEEHDARRIYQKLECDEHIFIDIQAHDLRQLAAMVQNVSFYFGNEGGTRHIAQAMGTPSFVICSPSADKQNWIPQNDVPAEGVATTDFMPKEQQYKLNNEERYNLIPKDAVWKGLRAMLYKLNLMEH
jgi:heptosyltransferase-2